MQLIIFFYQYSHEIWYNKPHGFVNTILPTMVSIQYMNIANRRKRTYCIPNRVFLRRIARIPSTPLMQLCCTSIILDLLNPEIMLCISKPITISLRWFISCSIEFCHLNGKRILRLVVTMSYYIFANILIPQLDSLVYVLLISVISLKLIISWAYQKVVSDTIHINPHLARVCIKNAIRLGTY